MCTEKPNITLLLNTHNIFDRKIIEGVGQYIKSTKSNWNILLKEDFKFSSTHLANYTCDGIIASFDIKNIESKLANIDAPVIGLSGSVNQQYNKLNLPYVATDNFSIIEAAYSHLKKKGLQHFAYYGLPDEDIYHWSIEREEAFTTLVNSDDYNFHIFRESLVNADTRLSNTPTLKSWLEELPKPIGIICTTDNRARLLMNTCEELNILVPEQVSVIGIDNDDISQNLSKISLSSVSHDYKAMGFEATKLLHRQILNKKIPERTIIKPSGITSRQSSDHIPLQDPCVMQAMHFIQNNACKGIKVDQVLYYIGMSRSTLEPRFIEERGHTIHTEIHNEKLSRACHHLTSTSLPLSEVAKLSGYPSLQYMYSIFKKRYNQTPKEYRKVMQEEQEQQSYSLVS